MDVPVKGPDATRPSHFGTFTLLRFTGMAPKRLLVVFDFDWYFPQFFLAWMC